MTAPATDIPEGVDLTCAYCMAFSVGTPVNEMLVCECLKRCGSARCNADVTYTGSEADRKLTYPEELQASIDTYRNLAHQCLDHSQFDDAQRHALMAEGIRYALDHWREMAAAVPTPAACGRHDCYQCATEDL